MTADADPRAAGHRSPVSAYLVAGGRYHDIDFARRELTFISISVLPGNHNIRLDMFQQRIHVSLFVSGKHAFAHDAQLSVDRVDCLAIFSP